MENLINQLVFNNCFEKHDAVVLAKFIVQQENITDIENYDISKAYEDYGSRWHDEELAENYNDGLEGDKIPTENIFNHMQEWESTISIIRLPSNLIVTWGY